MRRNRKQQDRLFTDTISCRTCVSNLPLRVTINETEPQTAGSTVTGKVHVANETHIEKVPNEIALYLIGEEEATIMYANGDGTTQSSHSSSEIVRMRIPIADTGLSMQSGKHEFPFQFDLPEYLPSSMFENSTKGCACIRYMIKAEAKRDSRLLFKFEHTLTIAAKPPVNHVPIPKCVEPIASNIRLLYCIPRGYISFAANVSNTCLGNGETLEIGLGCKNDSSTDIMFARAVVKQTVKWISDGFTSGTKKSIVEKTFGTTDDMTPRNKRQTVKQEMHNTTKSEKQRRLLSETLDALKQSDNIITLEIPPDALHSYVGNLITVEHDLWIKVKTAFGSTSPKAKVNMQIIPPRQSEVVAGSSLDSSVTSPVLQGPDCAGSTMQSDAMEARPIQCLLDRISPIESDRTEAFPAPDGHATYDSIKAIFLRLIKGP